MKGIVSILLIILLMGCQANNDQDVRSLQLEGHAVIDQHQSDRAKKIVSSMKEVIEVKGVNVEKDIYLAPNVKHFQRLRLQKIRKQGHDAVKKQFPDANVHLSTDKKIFMELDKIEQELKNKQISEKRLKEKLKKIEEMMKG